MPFNGSVGDVVAPTDLGDTIISVPDRPDAETMHHDTSSETRREETSPSQPLPDLNLSFDFPDSLDEFAPRRERMPLSGMLFAGPAFAAGGGGGGAGGGAEATPDGGSDRAPVAELAGANTAAGGQAEMEAMAASAADTFDGAVSDAASMLAGGSASALTAAERQTFGEDYGRLPLSFEANLGQTDGQVDFLARGPGYNLFVTPTEAVLVLNKPDASEPMADVLRVGFAGANPSAEAVGLEQLPGNTNYFRGPDPSKWFTDIPNYARVSYQNIYSGIDLVYYGTNQRQLEYDFIVTPGADPGVIELTIQGAREMTIDAQGNLLLPTEGGEVTLKTPVVYQETDGLRQEVAAQYQLLGDNRVGITVGVYDATRPLVIDPVLSYSTYLGGSGDDSGYGIAVDDSGNAYVTGVTSSMNFPTVNAFQVSRNGPTDAFITKINSTGSGLVYSTYLGGMGPDEGQGIAVDASGNAYITGTAYYSAMFPTTAGAFQTMPQGQLDGFVTKLNATGNGLVYSTFLGGMAFDNAYAIAVDSAGSAFVTGPTQSSNFPVTAGAYQTKYAAFYDAFVVKFNSSGSGLVYGTFLGGAGNESGRGIAVDGSGIGYIVGETSSTNFPTLGAIQGTFGGGQDAFITQLSASGSALSNSTYLGGTAADYGSGIALDSSGNIFVTGHTASTDFPTLNPQQATLGGGTDAFVAKLLAGGSALAFSTYLGGTGNDDGRAIAADSYGSAFVIGSTSSTNFPVTADAYQSTLAGGTGNDGFLTRVRPDGSLTYGTFFGGNGTDDLVAISLDRLKLNEVYLIGTTQGGAGFPLEKPYQSQFGGGNTDAFVTKFNPPPALIDVKYIKESELPDGTIDKNRFGDLDENNPDGDGGTDATDTPKFLGGWRIFPDAKTFATRTTPMNFVRVRATIANAQADTKVYFRAFDVDDPCNDLDPCKASTIDLNDYAGGMPVGKIGLDNRGKADGANLDQAALAAGGYRGRLRPLVNGSAAGQVFHAEGAAVPVTVANGIAEVDLGVSFNAGDNFRVAVSLNEGELIPPEGGVTALNDTTDVPTKGEVDRFDFTGLLTLQLSVWRKFHIEQDRMTATEGDKQTGKIIVPCEVLYGGAWRCHTNIDISTANAYEQGILRTTADGKNYNIIGNIRGPGAWVDIVSATAPEAGDITIYEDDWIADGDGVPTPRRSPQDDQNLYDFMKAAATVRTQNRYADAYLEAEYNALNNSDSNNVTSIPHGPDFVTVNKFNDTRFDGNETDFFWAVYVCAAYEPEVNLDNDPNSESSEYGVTDSNDLISLIYVETTRDVALELQIAEAEARARNTAHEVGHQFDLALALVQCSLTETTGTTSWTRIHSVSQAASSSSLLRKLCGCGSGVTALEMRRD